MKSLGTLWSNIRKDMALGGIEYKAVRENVDDRPGNLDLFVMRHGLILSPIHAPDER